MPREPFAVPSLLQILRIPLLRLLRYFFGMHAISEAGVDSYIANEITKHLVAPQLDLGINHTYTPVRTAIISPPSFLSRTNIRIPLNQKITLYTCLREIYCRTYRILSSKRCQCRGWKSLCMPFSIPQPIKARCLGHLIFKLFCSHIGQAHVLTISAISLRNILHDWPTTIVGSSFCTSRQQ